MLLLDEPFAAVDRSVRRALQHEIDSIRRTVDIPVVLVTHDFEDVVRLATHLAIIRARQVVAHGTLTSLTSRPDVPWLREAVGLGTVVDATVARVDAARRLAELDIGGRVLLVPRAGLTAGDQVRVSLTVDLVLQFLGCHLHHRDTPMRQLIDELRAARPSDLGGFRLGQLAA